MPLHTHCSTSHRRLCPLVGSLVLTAVLVGCASRQRGATTMIATQTIATQTLAPGLAKLPLPPGAVGRLGVPPLGGVSSVALSRDGKLLVAGCDDRTVRLFAVEGRAATPLGAPFKHEGPVRAVALSPDGELVASAGGKLDPRIVVRAVASGKVLQVLKWVSNAPPGEEGLHNTGFAALAFSPDAGRLVSGSYSRAVELWDLKTSKQLWSAEPAMMCGGSCPESEQVRQVTFSPDGQRVLSVNDTNATLWRAADGKQVKLAGAGAACKEPEEPEEPEEAEHGGGEPEPGNGNAGDEAGVDEDDQPATCSFDDSGAWVYGAAFAPGGALVAIADGNGCVSLYGPKAPCRALRADTRGSTRNVWFSGTEVWVAGKDGTIRVWSLKTMKVLRTLKTATTATPLTWSAAGLITGAQPDSSIQLWKRTGPGLKPLTSVQLWPPALLKARAQSASALREVVFSPDGEQLQTIDARGRIQLWDVAARRLKTTLTRHKKPPLTPSTLAVSSDSVDSRIDKDELKLAQGDAAELIERNECNGADCDVPYIQRSFLVFVSPRHHRSASVSEGKISVDDVTIPSAHKDDYQSAVLGFSADATILASASYRHEISVWSLRAKSNTLLAALSGHHTEVTSVAFARSIPLLATGAADGTIIVWDWKRKRRLRTVRTLAGQVSALAFSPDDKLIASANADGTVLLYPAPPR